jgi:hypothetical protein
MRSTDLTEQSLEEAVLQIRQLAKERGEVLALKPTKILVRGDWLGITDKHYKVVKHPTKPYVRNYKREVPGGVSFLQAMLDVHYATSFADGSKLFED